MTIRTAENFMLGLSLAIGALLFIIAKMDINLLFLILRRAIWPDFVKKGFYYWRFLNFRIDDRLRSFRNRVIFVMAVPSVLWLILRTVHFFWFNKYLMWTEYLEPVTLRNLGTFFGGDFSFPAPIFVPGLWNSPSLMIKTLASLFNVLMLWFYFNHRAQTLVYPNFARDLRMALLLAKPSAEINERNLPKVTFDYEGAQIDFTGFLFSFEKFLALVPAIQNKMGCTFLSIQKGKNSAQIKYTYEKFPKVIPFPEDYVSTSPRFIPFATNTKSLVGLEFDKYPHAVFSGLPGYGKTVGLLSVLRMASRVNPNTIALILDPSTKDGIDFGFLKYDPEDLFAFRQNRLSELEMKPFPNVVLATEMEQVYAVIAWAMQETRIRAGMCSDPRYLCQDVFELWERAYYKDHPDEIRPTILLVCDEMASLHLAFGEGGRLTEPEKQMKGDAQEMIRVGRAFDIHFIFALQSMRFSSMGETRRLFRPHCYHSLPGEVELALEQKVEIPPEKGVFAYPDGGGFALAKSFMTTSAQVVSDMFGAAKRSNKATQNLFLDAYGQSRRIFNPKFMADLNQSKERSRLQVVPVHIGEGDESNS